MWDRFSELVGGSGDDSVLTAAESARAVHYSERIDIAQAIEAGDELRTDATIVAVGLRPGGATLLTRFDTRLAGDDFRTVCVSWSGSYYRGVELLGPAHALPDLLPPVLPPPPPPSTSSASLSPPLSAGTMPDCVTITPAIAGKQDQGARPLLKEMIDITAVEAHIYSECARIWNPIHTDEEFARSAHLPTDKNGSALLLHGTATLAKAVSCIITRMLGDDPRRVRSVVCGSFGAMVRMPSAILVIVHSVETLGDGTIDGSLWARPRASAGTGRGLLHFSVCTVSTGPGGATDVGPAAVRGGAVVFDGPLDSKCVTTTNTNRVSTFCSYPSAQCRL